MSPAEQGLLTPDICVIGAGSGGLSVAAGAAAFGASVVLIERGAMGGDCLNVGCVPSKALLAAAHRAADMREAAPDLSVIFEPQILAPLLGLALLSLAPVIWRRFRKSA